MPLSKGGLYLIVNIIKILTDHSIPMLFYLALKGVWIKSKQESRILVLDQLERICFKSSCFHSRSGISYLLYPDKGIFTLNEKRKKKVDKLQKGGREREKKAITLEK